MFRYVRCRGGENTQAGVGAFCGGRGRLRKGGGMMLDSANKWLNDLLGLGRPGWSEELPSAEILLIAIVLMWVMWVTTKVIDDRRAN